jgi:hypothetical protein
MSLQELKLNLNCKLKTENKINRNINSSGPISLKETGPAVDADLAHKGTQIRPNGPTGGPSALGHRWRGYKGENGWCVGLVFP